jgi:flotillin
MEILTVGGVVAILGVVLVVAVVAGIAIFFGMRTWVKVARADEALVLSGSKKDKAEGSKLEVIVNGRAIVNPVTRRHEVISLRSRKVELNVGAQSLDGVTLQVKASALVKIASTEEMVIRAAERFASQDAAIEQFTGDQLEGSLRGVIALLNVSELMKERKKFSDQIAESVSQELSDQGLQLDSFQITDISDNANYISSLGKPEIEAKRQAAEIAQTNAARAILQAQTANKEADLIEQTALDTNRANSESEIGKARANAEQAEALARAQAKQAVLNQDAENKQSELDATVKKVADADKYAAISDADSKAYARQKQAEAQQAVAQTEADAVAYTKQKQAEADELVMKRKADADAYALKAQADARKETAAAEAEAIRVKSEAEAGAVMAMGEANASAVKAEAEALRENSDVILAKELIAQLPALMESHAKGYERIGKMTIIGDANSASSAANGHTAAGMAGFLESVKEASGIDIGGLINGQAIGRATGQAIGENINQNQD